MQICDNLSVSAAPSQLPWKGSQGMRTAGSTQKQATTSQSACGCQLPWEGSLVVKNRPRAARGASFYCFSLVLSAKYSFVSFATTPERAKRAMKFGMAMRPLKVSAMSHTTSSEATAPTTTMMMNRT